MYGKVNHMTIDEA
jgi:hypothetical protein